MRFFLYLYSCKLRKSKIYKLKSGGEELDHYFNFLNKRNYEEIVKTPVTVTLKVDGTPLQVVIEGNNISFHKRPASANKIGNLITDRDMITNVAFSNVISYLKKAVAENIEFFKTAGIKILNFEILIKNEIHDIKYKKLPKNGLCLLNGFFSSGDSINFDNIEMLSKKLDVGYVPVIFKGILSSMQIRLLENYVSRYCNPKKPESVHNFVSDIKNKILKSDVNNSLLSTENGKVEGFVFNFSNNGNHYFTKIDDPSFIKDSILNNKMHTDKSFDNIAHIFSSSIDLENLKKMDNDEVVNYALNYLNWKSRRGSKEVDSVYNKIISESNPAFHTPADINSLPDNLRFKFTYNDRVLFRLWMWVIKRRKINGPLSQEMKDRMNEFTDAINKI